jgi:hypothetical protein
MKKTPDGKRFSLHETLEMQSLELKRALKKQGGKTGTTASVQRANDLESLAKLKRAFDKHGGMLGTPTSEQRAIELKYVAKLISVHEKYGGTLGITASEWRAEFVEHARTLLRKRGLPTTPVLFKVADGWSERRPDNVTGVETLANHIGSRFPRDSLEDIAARIINTAHYIDGWTGDPRDGAIFELGVLVTLLRVYALDSAAHCAPGEKRAKQRWAGNDRSTVDEIVARLARKPDALGDPLLPKELWPLLYNALEDAGLDPKEDGNLDCPTDTRNPAKYTFTGGSITYDTFRKRIQRARRPAAAG